MERLPSLQQIKKKMLQPEFLSPSQHRMPKAVFWPRRIFRLIFSFFFFPPENRVEGVEKRLCVHKNGVKEE